MYGNQRSGYGVYKKSQVNLGNPFAVQPSVEKRPHREFDASADDDSFVPVDALEKARREAAMIVREAELESDRMLAEARDKIVTEAEDAQRRARETGYAEGERQAQRQYQALIAEAEQTLHVARTEYRETMAAMEADMVDLVLDIAKKAVGERIETNPDTILSVIRTTLADITPAEHVIVKISTLDYPYAMEHMDKLIASLPFLCELDVRRDASLPKGGCIIDTGRGTVDGGVDSRMRQIEDSMRALLIGRPETPVTDLPVMTGED